MSGADRQCGFVALIGAPNAGKSTLLNTLLGTKISIVTHKVQTTRARARGILIKGRTQIIFVDTPGIFKPKRTLDEAMVQAAWEGVRDADCVVVLVDAARGPTGQVTAILDGLERRGQKVILALNKIDLIDKKKLLALANGFQERQWISDIFMISAESGSGVADLLAGVAARLPAGPWLYPEDQVADMPMKMLAAEVTREKLFLRLHEELPYSLSVETEDWQEKDDGSVRIGQVIYVSRKGHKGIVLGKGGASIKEIGKQARLELEGLMDCRVHLFLRVVVRPKWAEEPERLRALGLDFPR